MKVKARKSKPKAAWTVTTADPYSDEPSYKAYVSAYANRDKAFQCMKGSAEEDAEFIDGELRWRYDEDTDEPLVEVVDRLGDVRWTYMLERKIVMK